MNNNFNIEMLQEWAETVEPVFIVGPERSGTSMVFRTVVSHPSFCSFDNATVETFVFIRPHMLLEGPSPDNYEMRLYLGQKFNNFYKATESIRKVNEMCDAEGIDVSFLGGNQRTRAHVWQKRKYRDLLRTFFYFSWLNLGEKRLAEKTPAHIRCIDELFDCFPKARVLVCLRDPVEIVASHRKRLAKEVELGKNANDPNLQWLSKSAEEYAQYFNLVRTKVAHAKKRYGYLIKPVSYGRITTDQSYLREVFNFLGEEYISPTYESDSLAPDWDPLLSSAKPQKNTIDSLRWMSEEEAALLRKACAAEGFAAWR